MSDLLILVDFQEDYLKDTNTQPHPDALVQTAAHVLAKCRAAGMHILHIRTTITKETDKRMAHWKASDRWQCVKGTPGHATPVSLAEVDGEYVIHKSGFDPFEDGQLRPILLSGQFDQVVICGIHLHACVRAVIAGVFSAGLKVCVVDDAVGSNDPLHAAICRRYYEERMVQFVKAADLEVVLKSPSIQEARCGSRVSDSFEKWKKVTTDERIKLLRRIAHQLREESNALGALITNEIGKPISFSIAEVRRTADMIEDIIQKFKQLALEEDFECYSVRYQPLGLVAIITPWNNPVYISLGKIIPAILFGNTVIWKPSPSAIQISHQVINLFERCGLHARIVALLEGDRKVVAKLLRDPLVQGVTFTGSLGAGYGVQELCARRHIPYQAELGGNNAAIIWEDADVSYAARKVCSGAFEMAGQRCTANRRVIVHERCADAFLTHLKSAMKEMRLQDPNNEDTKVGPVVSKNEKERILAVIRRASDYCEIYQVAEHAVTETIVNWVAPTLIICHDPASEIFQEETFGPVLVMHIVSNWEEAIESCNGVKQGLVAAIFTTSSSMKERFLSEANAGILKVNNTTSDALLGAPFGGWKASGIGPPEHGFNDRDFYTRIQTVYR